MKSINFLNKLTITVLLVIWASVPYIDTTISEKTSDTTFPVGFTEISVSVISIVAFLIIVALYVNSLQTCLTLIKPENRKAKPKTVWYMFLLPFNFIEDFFIVIDISNSIEAEAKTNEKLSNVKDFGMVTGIGWCVTQIMWFIPNYVGQISGIICCILIIVHWVQIHKINKLLLSENEIE
jgi:divalent metal cation (Fe/Co/Zn/Cd) transporter